MVNPSVPKNIEAEVALLGCIFVDENIMISVLDEINYNDFYDIKNKEIFKVMQTLYTNKKSIDITTVCAELIQNDKYNVVGGTEYISSIANFTYTTANIDSYITLVREASLKRKAIDSLNKLIQEGYDSSKNANDYLTDVEREIFELSKNRKTGNFDKIDSVVEIVRKNAEINANRTEEITGLDTGFKNLNKITLGLQKENLIILAARPAMGKSAFAMNLATQVAMNNKDARGTVAVFSLEMSADQLVERMISADSLVDLTKLRKGNLSGTDGILFSAASEKLSKLNLYFDDSSSITVEDIRTKCRKLSAEVGLDFVVIDYLQLIRGDTTKAKHEEVSGISRALKLMARELHVPVLALAQLSRDVEKREDKKPIMADLRDSGSIEQDADIVMFLYREDYYKPKTSDRPGEADLIISKNRSGSAGVELKYLFQGQYSKFIDNDREEN